MTIDPATLAEWRRLADTATAGPWKHVERTRDTPTIKAEVYKDTVEDGDGLSLRIDCDADEPDLCEADAKFIAAARTAVPLLLDEVARLRAERDRLRAIALSTPGTDEDRRASLDALKELLR